VRKVDGARDTRRADARETDRRRTREARFVFLVLVGGLFACVTTWTPPEPRSYHRVAPVADSTELAGAEECEVCHEDVAGRPLGPEYHADCEACHGPGMLHTESEEVTDIRFPSSADCERCHGEGHATLIGWPSSPHEKAGVLCSDCHDTHNREPNHIRTETKVDGALLRHASGVSRLCSSCHPTVAASFTMPSHHPVLEGMLDCTDCHTPHADRRVALGARVAACTQCHENHSGPWIYEHPPVAEDCGYCHAPHGTSSFNLLETTEPGACISCHTVAEAGAVHDPFAFLTRCTDCHGAVHGSYTDPHLMR